MHVEVVGAVQGVGFRWFIREQARTLHVGGWVRNREDGAVEVAARGEPGALEALRAAVQSGPLGAHVTAVRDLPPLEEGDLPEDFRIVR
jgi:acylphosphatase